MTREAIATMVSECYVTNNLIYNDQVSAIYQGLDTNTGKVVMLQTFATSLKQHPAYEQWTEQFLELSDQLQQVHHPHLVKVVGLFHNKNKHYLVSETPIGLTLDRYLRQQGKPLTPDQALPYIKQIARALEALHRNNLYHQNLDPSHIYLLPLKEKAYLSNFGWQHHLTPGLSRLFPDILNPGYSPLEQYQIYHQGNAASDIYGLAGILFFMLTGKTPPSAPDRQKTPWQDWQTYAPQFPPTIQKLMLEGLKINNKERPQSIHAWLELFPEEVALNKPSQKSTLADPLPSLQPHPEFSSTPHTSHTEPTLPLNLAQPKTTPIFFTPTELPPELAVPHSSTAVPSTKTADDHAPTLQIPLPKEEESTAKSPGKSSPRHGDHHEWRSLFKFALIVVAIGSSAGLGFGTALLFSSQQGKDVDIFKSDQSFPPVGEWPVNQSR